MAKVDFEDALAILNFVGLSPKASTLFSKARVFLVCSVTGLTILFCSMELLLNYQGLESASRAFQTAMPQTELALRIIVLIVYKKEFGDLIDDCRLFWELNRFGEIVESQLAETHDFVRRWLRFYRATFVVSIIVFLSTGVYFYDKRPLVMCYGESEGIPSPYYEMYFVLHSLITTEVYFLFGGYETLVFYLMAHMVTEMRMIQFVFGEEVDNQFGNHKERFRAAVTHHIFVLEFLQKFNNVNSVPMLINFLVGQFGVCFSLFVAFQYGMPPPADLYMMFPIMACLVMKSFLFSYAGEMVTGASLQIPDAIFYSSFASGTTSKNKQCNVLCLRRAQEAATVKLGPFGFLNLSTFTMLLKNAFSFFTFLNSFVTEKA